MLKVVLCALFAVSYAAPFWWQRDFFVGLYQGFTGSSGSLYYNCLTDTEQYALQDAMLMIGKDYAANKSITVIIEDVFEVVYKLFDVYEECKLDEIPEALLMTILREGPMVIARFLMNFETIAKDFGLFWENLENEPTQAGKYMGALFKTFLDN